MTYSPVHQHPRGQEDLRQWYCSMWELSKSSWTFRKQPGISHIIVRGTCTFAWECWWCPSWCLFIICCFLARLSLKPLYPLALDLVHPATSHHLAGLYCFLPFLYSNRPRPIHSETCLPSSSKYNFFLVASSKWHRNFLRPRFCGIVFFEASFFGLLMSFNLGIEILLHYLLGNFFSLF